MMPTTTNATATPSPTPLTMVASPTPEQALNKLILDNTNVDPAKAANGGKSKRVTKQDFSSGGGGLLGKKGGSGRVGDENDPLSQLDPLWSLK